MHCCTQIVAETRQSQFLGSGRSSDGIGLLVYDHRTTGLLEDNGSSQPVGSRSDHYYVVHVRIMARGGLLNYGQPGLESDRRVNWIHHFPHERRPPEVVCPHTGSGLGVVVLT